MNDIATALWKKMTVTGSTQADIANAVGCSPAAVGNWLHEKDLPRPKWHAGIAGYLGWEVEDVLRAAGFLPTPGNGHGDPKATPEAKERAAISAALGDLDLYELGVMAQLAHVLQAQRVRRQGEGPSTKGTANPRPLRKRSRPA